MVQSLTPYQLTLLPASFGGVAFFVVDTSLRGGLRIAEHQYPYRNTPYSEPMGRQARQYVFDAFLVGDDVATQYETLLSVIETNQAQTLIHPTLGSKTVVCAGAEFTQNVAGRYVECRLAFIEAGEVINPGTGADTQADTINKAADAQSSSTNSFGSDVSNTNDQQPGSSSSMNPPAAGTGTTTPASVPPSPAAEIYNDTGDRAVFSDTTGFA